MEPQKHEMNEKRLIRWLIIAVLALLAVVLGLQAWRLLFPSTDRLQAAGVSGVSEPMNASESKVSSGKTAMVEDVQALNPALSFDELAALSAEELEQLCEAAAPPDRVPIGLSQAAHVAEEYAGTLAVDSVTWDVDPELDEVPAHYEVELHHITLGDFEYKIDAYTGQVLEGQPNILQSTYVPASSEAEQPAPEDSTQPAAPRTDAHVPQAAAPAAQQPASGQQAASGESSTASGGQTAQSGEDTAKAAAFTHAGVAEADVTGLRVKSDWEDGVRVYEIEFHAGGVEYDYEVEAASGVILKSEREWGGSAGQTSGTLIGEEAAKTAALTHAGVQAANVSYIRVKLDRDDGVQVYEVEFVSGGMEYDYDIDAVSGTVRKAEQDRAD